MRTELAKFMGRRLRFEAVVGRFGTKMSYKGWSEKTILLNNIMLVGGNYIVTDHLWFTVRLTLDALKLKSGDRIRFDARVTTYMKGGRLDKQLDYKLAHPTNFATGEESSNPNQSTCF